MTRPRRPLLALAVFAGGAVAGAVLGLGFAGVAVGVPELHVWWRGGTPQVGLVLVGALIGGLLGAMIGAVAGAAGCAALGLAWALRLPRGAAMLVGAVVVATASAGLVIATGTWHPQTVALALLAAVHAAAGVAAAAHLASPPLP
ncbi:MAG: hypothetical protein Q7T71_08745 [Herbiconiux sp.]|nr:hypothetical protein [Herbiconiux sp.]